jgi:hypothetical protein
MARFQYQAKAEPVLVPAAATVPALSWAPVLPPLGPRRRTSTARPYCAQPVGLGVGYVTWSYPDSLARAKRLTLGGVVQPVLVPAPVVVPDLSWAPVMPVSARAARRGLTLPYTADPTTPQAQGGGDVHLGWLPTYPDRAGQRTRTRWTGIVEPLVPLQAAPTPHDWRPVSADVIRRRLGLQGITVGPVAPVAAAPEAPSDWWPVYPPGSRLRTRSAFGSVVAPVAPVAAAATPSDWWPLYPVGTGRRSRTIAGGLVAPFDVLVPGDWGPSYPTWALRAPTRPTGTLGRYLVEIVGPVAGPDLTFMVDAAMTRAAVTDAGITRALCADVAMRSATGG